MSRAIFLDRDGTIIRDENYLRDPGRITMLPGALEALADLKSRGFSLVVITNQSGLARGLIREDEHAAVRAEFERQMSAAGVPLAGYYFCPHAPTEGCACRKPGTAMIEQASLELGLDIPRSFMVGDRESDIVAGKRAGCKTAFLAGPSAHLDYGADVTAAHWDALHKGILRHDF